MKRSAQDMCEAHFMAEGRFIAPGNFMRRKARFIEPMGWVRTGGTFADTPFLGMPSNVPGFSPELKKCPPDTFLPTLRVGRSLRIPLSQKKEALRMECFFFLGWIMGFEPTTFRATI